MKGWNEQESIGSEKTNSLRWRDEFSAAESCENAGQSHRKLVKSPERKKTESATPRAENTRQILPNSDKRERRREREEEEEGEEGTKKKEISNA